ncbi:MAG: hypothetical protein J6B91_01490 [Prevotella sp.]|nr:hypothetical protein [Prevotella sp.]
MFDPVKSPFVEEQLEKDNFLIEDNPHVTNKLCCIYFSSHGVYYPETEENFKDKIFQKNVFEWYKRRLPHVKRHVFVRDIRKQFYVEGINKTICNIDKLIIFLKKVTFGFDVITVGSSAGGYISAIVGGEIKARCSFCFSGQFSLKDDFAYPTKELLLKHENDCLYSKWYDITNICKGNIVYMYPTKSECDIVQSTLLKKGHNEANIIYFPMKAKTHGIPLYKPCIKKFISLDLNEIQKIKSCFIKNNEISLFLFSLKLLGIKGTIKGLVIELILFLRKIIK